MYKWTATNKWISWIEITCEKKEPVVDPLKEFEDSSSPRERNMVISHFKVEKSISGL